MLTESSPAFQRALRLAKAKAAAKNQSYAVVEIDQGDCREVFSVPEWYCDTDEFVAFDGKVLALVDPL